MRHAGTRLFFALACAAILAACSTATRVAYNNAASLYSNAAPMIQWAVEDYVAMNGPQREWVRARIDQALAWHRREELPGYRRYLESTLVATQRPVTVEEAASLHLELRARYMRTVERLLPDAAEFLVGVDAEQVASLEEKIAESNRKYQRERMRGTPEEKRKRDLQRATEHLEAWIGTLEAPQRAILERHAKGFIDLTEERLADSRFRQREFLALVRAKPDKETMLRGLRRLSLQHETWRNPEFTRKLRERDRQTHAMLAELSASLSAEQRAALAKRIRGYMQDINELTAVR